MPQLRRLLHRPFPSRLLLMALPLALLLSACFQQAPPTSAPEPSKIAPQALGAPLLADFEPDPPPGFFTFAGASSVATSTPTIADGDPLARPGQVGDNGVLQVDFNITDFGGFGQDVSALGGPQDWTDFEAIAFWFYGSGSGLPYQIEISDNRSDPGTDTSERFDLVFTDDSSGWQWLVFPFDTFTRATDFQPGGAPDDGFGRDEVWAWAVVLPQGVDTIYLDDVALLSSTALADFEPDPPPGFFTFAGASSVATSTPTIADGDPLARPGQVGDNGVLQVDFNITDFGGFGQDVSALGGPQDWTDFEAIAFWFYGSGSGLPYQIEISDNRSDPGTDTSERFDLVFTDDSSGWQWLVFPFDTFTRATDFQPGGAPDDGFGRDEVWAWAVVLPQGVDTIYLDDVALLGPGEPTLRVGFAPGDLTVVEGDTATITVQLTAPAPAEVRVDYASGGGSAVPGSDYESVAGTLIFATGDSSATFSVTTLPNDIEDGNRTVDLTLAGAVGAELGANSSTTLTIIDDDAGVPDDLVVVDDFENGLPSGRDGDGVAIGFATFSGGSPVSITTTGAPPDPVPGAAPSNDVLALDVDVAAFAGFVHAFENPAVDTWVSQDWSAYEGFGFWFYGAGSGAVIFVDILDNRNPGSTSDDAERLSTDFRDDVPGWRFVKLPFSEFQHKEIGNGAPNDGFGLTEVHGWALGSLATGGPRTFYVDDAGVYGTAPLRPLTVSFAGSETTAVEGDSATVTVALSRPLGDGEDDPSQVSVSFSSEPGSAVPGRDYTPPTDRTLTFVTGGPLEQSVDVATFDNDKRDYDRTVILRLSDPVGSELGLFGQSVVAILDDESRDPNLIDDMEQGVFLWDAGPGSSLSAVELSSSDPHALPGQGRFETVLQAALPLVAPMEVGGNPCKNNSGVVPVTLRGGPGFAVADVDVDSVRFGGAAETHRTRSGAAQRHEEDGTLTFHFRAAELSGACAAGGPTLSGTTLDGTPFVAGTIPALQRDFALGRDWSSAGALAFWFHGSGSGAPVTVTLNDNRAPDPGPSGWQLVWSDEFDDPAGTPPNADNWSYELGDGAVNRIPGWGNDELEYYTDDQANAATDGNGNLVITAREADGSLPCYYGPCLYSSARLISQHKAEFAYGRIESRLRVPQGSGLWPAFWSLGTDIAEVTWPQTGEIDFMEFVGRLPNEIFGTIHGPGYSGGQSYGNVYDFGRPVYDDYHTFTVEWEPNLIRWYVDGIQYHSATPSDVAPNEWVFNDPVFLLLNLAIGGNFGGPVGDDAFFPQEYLVDYVRVYQAPDSAERFEASFVDNFSGWQRVAIPFSAFTRSAEQPTGAPDDGLTLSEVWGYGLEAGGTIYLDRVRLE